MRILKIRYWDSDKKELVYPKHKDSFQLDFEKESIMVYTGLQDSVGQDIWDGDIVTFVHKVTLFKDIKFLDEKKGVVVYNQAIGSFEVEVVENGVTMFYPLTDVVNRGVVIGNVFNK
jgi:hypothetical protein